MPAYSNILVAIDFDGVEQQVLQRCVLLQQDSRCAVTVLHAAVSPMEVYGVYLGNSAYLDMTEKFDEDAIRDQLQEQLVDLVANSGLDADSVLVEFGRSVDVIVDQAERRNTDLIVLGSHGKHGLGLLLGSVANGVLHRAPCDVLAVRQHSD